MGFECRGRWELGIVLLGFGQKEAWDRYSEYGDERSRSSVLEEVWGWGRRTQPPGLSAVETWERL